MSIQQKVFVLSKKQVIEFIHGNITFEKLTEHIDFDEIDRMFSDEDFDDFETDEFDEIFDNPYRYECDSPYYVTVSDLIQGLKAYYDGEGKEASVYNWYINIFYHLAEAIHLHSLLGFNNDDSVFHEIPTKYCFFRNDYEMTKYVLNSFIYVLDGKHSGLRIETVKDDFTEILDNYDSYLRFAGKPHRSWILTDNQKRNLLIYFEKEKILSAASDEDKELYRKYMLELAEKNDIVAIEKYGYATYGNDNPVFDCDWKNSEECMLKLLELGDDIKKGQAANTLGYIYYYGRLNNGTPDYEKAYLYYSYASFFGFYEATYKVADMLRDGRGIIKNQSASFRLYNTVFTDIYNRFECGEYSVMADIGLRLGSAYENAIGTEKDNSEAMYFYLLARMAIDERMRDVTFFGNYTVSESIRKGIYRLKNETPELFNKKFADISGYRFMDTMFNRKFECELEISVIYNYIDMEYELEIIRDGKYTYSEDAGEIPMVLPGIMYCKRTNRFSVSVPGKGTMVKVFEPNYNGGYLQADSYKIIKDNIVLYFGNRKVLEIRSGLFRIYREHNTDTREHKFVKVEFTPGGKTYDYLADRIGVKPGDYVAIDTAKGKKTVKVLEVFKKTEEELPINLEFYTKVSRVKDIIS